MIDADSVQPLPDDYAEDDDLWDRPTLKHVHAFARSRRACPDSTLAAVLVRADCQIPPWVKLPPIIGGRTALNLFAALVGESGAGKGASRPPPTTRSAGTTPPSRYWPNGH